MSEFEIKHLIEKARVKITSGKYKEVLSIVKKIEKNQPSKEQVKEYLGMHGLALFKLKRYYEAIITSYDLFIEVPLKAELIEELKEMLSHIEIHELLIKNIFTASRRNEILRDLIEGLEDKLVKGKLLMLFYVSSGDPTCEGMAYLISELDLELPYDNQFLEKEKAQIVVKSLRSGSNYVKQYYL